MDQPPAEAERTRGPAAADPRQAVSGREAADGLLLI